MIELFLYFYTLHPVSVIVWALFVHWVADFVMQADTEAQGKSSDVQMLNLHILKYTLVMLFLVGPLVALSNSVLHWVTDYFSSRECKKRWLAEDRHGFFVVIGLDQLLHTIPLVIFSYYLGTIYGMQFF